MKLVFCQVSEGFKKGRGGGGGEEREKGGIVMFIKLHQLSKKGPKGQQSMGKWGKHPGIHVHVYGISFFFFFSAVGFQIWYLLKRALFFFFLVA